MKVVITNPPWETPKGYYGIRSNSRWPHVRPDKHLQFPIYLAYTSSLLKSKGHEVLAFDAVAEELNSDEFCNKINIFKPEAVFMECSTPSFEQDIVNAKKIKKLDLRYLYLEHTYQLLQKKLLKKIKKLMDLYEENLN